MKIFDENNKLLDSANLNYDIGYLTKKGEQEYVYYLFTPQQLIERRLYPLKEELESTNEQAIQFADGDLSEQEFAEIRTRRAEIKQQINQLESELVE